MKKLLKGLAPGSYSAISSVTGQVYNLFQDLWNRSPWSTQFIGKQLSGEKKHEIDGKHNNKWNRTSLQPVSRPVEQVPSVHPIYRETVFTRKKVELNRKLSLLTTQINKWKVSR